jgi:hypothetical protein
MPRSITEQVAEIIDWSAMNAEYADDMSLHEREIHKGRRKGVMKKASEIVKLVSAHAKKGK